MQHADPSGEESRPDATRVATPTTEGAATTGDEAGTIAGEGTVSARLRDGLTDGATPAWPGAVFGAWRGDQPVRLEALGDALRWEADAAGTSPVELPPQRRAPVTTDTIFDLASITKVFTSVICQVIVDREGIDLDTPLSRFFDAYRAPVREDVTLRHLFTHTAGLPPVNPIFRLPADQRRPAVLASELLSRPGEAFAYSCVGFQTLGLWAEKVTGRGLAELLAEIITGPLGLTSTGYCPTEPGSITVGGISPDRIAATELGVDPPRGMLRGVVHDEAAWSLDGRAGNAGIFSTTRDLGRFGRMLLGRGSLDGVQVLPERCFVEMVTPQLPEGFNPDYQHGLGVRIGATTLLGPSPTAFGHGGFTGTALAVSPEHDLVLVLLSNRVHPNRERTGDIWRQRKAVLDAAVAAYG